MPRVVTAIQELDRVIFTLQRGVQNRHLPPEVIRVMRTTEEELRKLRPVVEARERRWPA